jgi:hypothetical protein
MRIIQIIKTDTNKLIGLGDDGIVYKYVNAYDETDGSLGEMFIWKKITTKNYQTNDGIFFEEENEEFKNHQVGVEIEDFNLL